MGDADADATGVCTGRQRVEAGDEELSPFELGTSGLSTGAQWRRRGTGLSLRIALEMLELDCVSPAAASAAARPMSPLMAAPSSGSPSSPAPGGPRCWCEELSGATRSTCSEGPVDDRCAPCASTSVCCGSCASVDGRCCCDCCCSRSRAVEQRRAPDDESNEWSNSVLAPRPLEARSLSSAALRSLSLSAGAPEAAASVSLADFCAVECASELDADEEGGDERLERRESASPVPCDDAGAGDALELLPDAAPLVGETIEGTSTGGERDNARLVVPNAAPADTGLAQAPNSGDCRRRALSEAGSSCSTLAMFTSIE